MITLSNTNKKYQEIKDKFVLEIAVLDMKLEESQEKIAILNKMTEVFINLKSEDPHSRELAKYDFSKMNMTESISLTQVNEEIFRLQKEFGEDIDEYERLARRLGTFVKLLNTDKEWSSNSRDSVQIE